MKLPKHIVLTKEGTYRVRRMIEGQTHNKTFDSLAIAKEYVARLEIIDLEIKKGMRLPQKQKRKTIKDIMEDVINSQISRDLSPYTVRQSKDCCKRWLLIFPQDKVVPLEQEDVAVAEKWMSENCHNRTNRYRQSLIVFIKTAHRKASLPVPSFGQLKNLSEPRPVFQSSEVHLFQRFISALPRASVERAYTAMMFMTAMRFGEAGRLQLEEVNLEKKEVQIIQKNGRKATLVLCPLLIQELQDYLSKRAETSRKDFFIFEDGSPLIEASLKRRFTSASKRAGLPVRTGIGWVRNQAITFLGEAGMSAWFLDRVLLRHSQRNSLLSRYDQSNRPEEARRAYEILSRIWQGNSLLGFDGNGESSNGVH